MTVIAVVAYRRLVVEATVRMDNHRSTQRGIDQYVDAIFHAADDDLDDDGTLWRVIVCQDVVCRGRTFHLLPFVRHGIRRARLFRWRGVGCARITPAAAAIERQIDATIEGAGITKGTATIVHTDGIDQFDDARQTNEIVSAAATTGSASSRTFNIVEIGFQCLDGSGKGVRVHSSVGIRRGDSDFLSARNMERQTAIVGDHNDIATRISNEGLSVVERIARLDGAQLAIRSACESTAFD